MPSSENTRFRFGFLDIVEWFGNKLPEPATLFVLAAFIVIVLSHVGSVMDWSVKPLRQKMVAMTDDSGKEILNSEGKPQLRPLTNEKTGRPVLESYGDPIRPVSLLTRDGIYWAISTMVSNFIQFPPLGIILTAILGVGVAERSGLIGVILKALAIAVPKALLTPAIIFLGVNASITSDAGYIVLPPAAAALFMAAGRSPIAGIAAATGGVAAGFSANILITASDAMMAGFTESAARVIDSKYTVPATCNWYFMMLSTVVLTLTGWFVSARIVEPRFAKKPANEGGPAAMTEADVQAKQLSSLEKRGLIIAMASYAVLLTIILGSIMLKSGPLSGLAPNSERARWTQAIVPIIFISFLIPGIVYGLAVGRIRRERDVTELLVDSMRSMSGVIIVYFFAAQFVEYFKYSNLGRMLSMVGGQFLATSELSTSTLIIVFVFLVIAIDMVMSSMSAKYAVMAPIFVPMLMLVGISPQLTQAAYRVADSVTNNISPLNPYQILILKEMQEHAPKSAMGTLISTNMPYSIAFAIVWTGLILIWLQTGWPLGPGGPLHYTPTGH